MIRFFDILFSFIAVVILFPFMIPVMIGLKLTGEHYIFYLQPRIGKGGKEFKIIKFATMLKNSPNMPGGVLTQKNDPRILPMGKFLRTTKINELPQLINILIGQMSFIGPRPQAKQHYDLYDDEVKEAINKIPPGLSGIGSIVFRNEELILDQIHGSRDDFHDTNIAPYKGKLELWYCNHRSLRTNFFLILITIWVVIKPESDIYLSVFKDIPEMPKELKIYFAPPRTYLGHDLIIDIIQWDVNSWSKILKYWECNIEWNDVHACLELGGRFGGLSLWLALKGKPTICSDVANSEDRAGKLHAKYNVKTLISYQDIDATDIPYENHFDIVVFKSIIGGIGRENNIERQQKVFSEIYKALKPGGKLMFAENLIGSSLHQLLRRNFVKWGKSWRYISLEELDRFLSLFKSWEYKATGVLASLGRSEKSRNILAYVDTMIMNQLCPDRWKYIVYGIAEK